MVTPRGIFQDCVAKYGLAPFTGEEGGLGAAVWEPEGILPNLTYTETILVLMCLFTASHCRNAATLQPRQVDPMERAGWDTDQEANSIRLTECFRPKNGSNKKEWFRAFACAGEVVACTPLQQQFKRGNTGSFPSICKH